MELVILHLLIVWQAMDSQSLKFTGRLWGCNYSSALKVLYRKEIFKQKRLKKLSFKAFASQTPGFLKATVSQIRLLRHNPLQVKNVPIDLN